MRNFLDLDNKFCKKSNLNIETIKQRVFYKFCLLFRIDKNKTNNNQKVESKISSNLNLNKLIDKCFVQQVSINTNLFTNKQNLVQTCVCKNENEIFFLNQLDSFCLKCEDLKQIKKKSCSTFSRVYQKQTQTNNKNKNLSNEFDKLSKYRWYWGSINKNIAEEKLQNQPYGSFLLRDSSNEKFFLSLSFRAEKKVFHTRIDYHKGLFSFHLRPNTTYESIVDLVEDVISKSNFEIIYCIYDDKNGEKVSFPISLNKPFLRLNQVQSLKCLCKEKIKRWIHYDQIKNLPLPMTIQSYLEQNHLVN